MRGAGNHKAGVSRQRAHDRIVTAGSLGGKGVDSTLIGVAILELSQAPNRGIFSK